MKFIIQKKDPMIQAKEKVDIQSLIEDNDLVVIDFYADWCGPCKAMTPVIEELQKLETGALIVKVDVDVNQELAIKYQVSAIPRLMFIKNKTVVENLIGGQSKSKIISTINKYKS